MAVLLKVRVGGCWDDGEARSDERPTFGLTSLNFNHFGLGLIGPWGGSEAEKAWGGEGSLNGTSRHLDILIKTPSISMPEVGLFEWSLCKSK